MHEDRFRSSFFLSSGNPLRPIPSLLSAVLLWAIKISPPDQASGNSQTLLSRALSQIGLALKEGLSHEVVQVIQAHLLLASYLYAAGRFLEGRQQTAAAATLAVDCGFHRIRSADTSRQYLAYVDAMPIILPEPRDAIECGERVNAFWMAFCQDRAWGVTLGVDVIITDSIANGSQIDTAWPLNMEVYEAVARLFHSRFIGSAYSCPPGSHAK